MQPSHCLVWHSANETNCNWYDKFWNSVRLLFYFTLLTCWGHKLVMQVSCILRDNSSSFEVIFQQIQFNDRLCSTCSVPNFKLTFIYFQLMDNLLMYYSSDNCTNAYKLFLGYSLWEVEPVSLQVDDAGLGGGGMSNLSAVSLWTLPLVPGKGPSRPRGGGAVTGATSLKRHTSLRFHAAFWSWPTFGTPPEMQNPKEKTLMLVIVNCSLNHVRYNYSLK